MSHEEAIDFIQPAVTSGAFTWADLGAGSGVFTRAIATILGAEGSVYAVDQSQQVFNIKPFDEDATIHPMQADFTKAIDLPELDGILMANSLHYVLRKEVFLKKVLKYLKPGGIFILIEYDRTVPNPWVPYPIREQAFRKLAQKLGLSAPELMKRRPSNYGQGDIYSVMAIKS